MSSNNYFDIRYSFTSTLGGSEVERYINMINGSLLLKDSNNNVLDEAGRFKLRLVDVSLANDDKYSLESVFSVEHNLHEIGKRLYSFHDSFFSKEVCEYFENRIREPNLLVIDRIEIHPRFRGQNWGYKVMKDIKNRCATGCGLMALRILPLQHESMNILNEDEQEWQQKMKLEELESDREKAFYKLAGYYAGMGFHNIGGPDIFALNPAVHNPLDEVEVQFRVPAQ